MASATPRTTGHRERLLAAALECLQEKGYARTTARDLVAVSGTNLASIGYHFGSKEALLNEAIAEGFRAWTAEIEQTVFEPGEVGSVAGLKRSLTATLDRFAELRPLLIACVEVFPQITRSPELRQQVAAFYDEIRRATAGMIRRALEVDRVDVSPRDADAFASLLIAVCDGLMLQWLVDPERVPGSSEVMRAVAALAQSSEGEPRATRGT